jgi:hypothetical protein
VTGRGERVITRIAWRMGCQYEYGHHTRMAYDHGISRREIESLTNDDDPTWSDRTRILEPLRADLSTLAR